MIMTRQKRMLLTKLSGVLLIVSLLFVPFAHAATDPDHGFSLQVTPSPLVVTTTPGQTTTAELKIRNSGSDTENLRIEPRGFKINGKTGDINLNETEPAEISNWMTFSAPTFTIKSGEWFTEKITFALPKESGFSYSFALIISRQKEPKPISGGRLIHGSVAVFTLVNVDRPGATRQLDVTEFAVTKRVYEYLPATFEIRFKNTGNSIVQPYGNVFIQRGDKDVTPLGILPVNEQRGYILPDIERTLLVSWDGGFPVYKSVSQADGSTKNRLTWNWNDASDFRFGRFKAKLVAVYNDGTRDVPITAEITFWVIPWRMLLGFLVFLVILGFGLWSLIRKSINAAKSVKAKAQKS